MPPPPPSDLRSAAGTTSDNEEEGEDETSGLRDSISSQDDIKLLHNSLRKQSNDRLSEEADLNVQHLHETVQTLYDEEENLLNAHMNSIQENAELLTEEGVLLASIQGDDVIDYDIDAYSARLEQILEKKTQIIDTLRGRLKAFRSRLEDEESVSKKVNHFPLY